MKDKLPAVMSIATLGVAAYFIVAFVVVALVRMTYPFELEWMEGGCVDQVARVLAGQSLYVAPSLKFTPYIYAPLYFWVSAPFAAIFGTNLLALRLVSVLSTLGCLALLVQIVRRETGSTLGGIISAGVFAATYQLSDAWLDIARVDSLFMLLVLLSVLLLRRRKDALHLALAALALSGAFFTKQSTLLIAIPLCIYCVVAHRGILRFVFPVVLGVLCAAGVLGLHVATDGWSTYYLFDLPGRHWLVIEMYVNFWAYDLLRPMALSVVASVIALVLVWNRAGKHDGLFHLCLFAGMIGASWSSRLHSGGWYNCLIPAHVVLAIGLGMCAALLIEKFRSPESRIGQILVYSMCLAQLLGLIYSPQKKIPSLQDAQAGRAMVRVISRIEGPVLVLNHGYYASLGGKPSHGQGMALFDVLRSDDDEIKATLIEEIKGAIARREFGGIITSERGVVEDWFRNEMQGQYEHRGDLHHDPHIFWTTSGHRMRPQEVFILSEPAPPRDQAVRPHPSPLQPTH